MDSRTIISGQQRNTINVQRSSQIAHHMDAEREQRNNLLTHSNPAYTRELLALERMGLVGERESGEASSSALQESLLFRSRMSHQSNNPRNDQQNYTNVNQLQLTNLEMQQLLGSAIANEQNARRNQLLASLNAGNSSAASLSQSYTSNSNESAALQQLLQRTWNAQASSTGNSATAGLSGSNFGQHLATAAMPQAGNQITNLGWNFNPNAGLQMQSAFAQSRALEQQLGRLPGFLQSTGSAAMSSFNSLQEAQMVARVLQLSSPPLDQNPVATVLTQGVRDMSASQRDSMNHHIRTSSLTPSKRDLSSIEEKMSGGQEAAPPKRPYLGQGDLEALIDSPPASRRNSVNDAFLASKSCSEDKEDRSSNKNSSKPKAPKKRRVVPPKPKRKGKHVLPHYTERERHPLGIDEDHNWLSEFQCYGMYTVLVVCLIFSCLL
jgi:hypothetical protein